MPLHRSRTFSGYLAARTRFFDDQVIEASATGDCQIVVLGAGYDDRALRFRSKGVHFVEVDHPDTQRDKLHRLRRLGIGADDVTFVPVDFVAGDVSGALRGALIPELPSVFLCEGVIPYLPRRATEHLLQVASASPGATRRLAVEIPVRASTSLARLALGLLRLATGAGGERIRTVFSGTAEAQEALAGAGWHLTSWTQGRDLGMPAVTSDISYATATA